MLWWENLPRTSFGSKHMEERLAALILAGRKRATVWNGNDINPTAPGMKWLVTVANVPVGVIETLEVGTCRFHEIDENFAYEEGEGDRGLTYWRAVHEDFFRKEGHFQKDMLLWWEKFKLIEVIDPELAAKAPDHIALEEKEAQELLKSLTEEKIDNHEKFLNKYK